MLPPRWMPVHPQEKWQTSPAPPDRRWAKRRRSSSAGSLTWTRTAHLFRLSTFIVVATLLLSLVSLAKYLVADVLSAAQLRAFLMNQPLARSRRIWRSVELADGLLQQQLYMTSDDLLAYNVTETQAALRLAVVEPIDDVSYSSYRQPEHTILHFRFHMWDYPLTETNGVPVSAFYNSPDTSFYATIFRHGRMIEPYRTAPCELHWNPECQVPRDLMVMSDDERDSIAVTLHVEHKSREVGRFSLTLAVRDQPVSTMSICNKASYGTQKFEELLEWREHHRMLGFDMVYWSHREANFTLTVDKLNAITGGRDTFDWLPAYDTSGSGLEVTPWFDEWRVNDQCYVLHRFTSDWIGLWDHDEWFGLLTNESWTAEGVDQWRAEQESLQSGAVLLPFTWVDRARSESFSKEALVAANPALTSTEIESLSQVTLNRNSYYHSGAPDYRQFFKTFANAHWTRHLGIHHPIDVDGQARIVQDMTTATLYHARSWIHLDENLFQGFPLTKTVTEHWSKLADRMQELRRRAADYDARLARTGQR